DLRINGTAIELKRARPEEVVRLERVIGAPEVGKRRQVDQFSADPADATRRNAVARERRAVARRGIAGGGIEYLRRRGGELAGFHRRIRVGPEQLRVAAVIGLLVVREVEQVVLLDGAANGSAPLRVDQLRLSLAGRQEEGTGLENIIRVVA